MFGNLDVFQLAQSRAQHAGARQALIASNIANADTPGYRAQDMRPFLETYQNTQTMNADLGLRASRAGHFFEGSIARASPFQQVDRPSGASPSGNTVSLEMEMLEAIDADRAHNRAVTIYETALGILRSSLRSGR